MSAACGGSAKSEAPDAAGSDAQSDAPVDSAPLAPVTVNGSADLSTTAVTAGRTCAESPAFSVTALAAKSATLASAPDVGCLAAGDEVLLIDLQGAPGEVANVGNWELLRVASVAGSSVGFTATKTRSYGDAAGSDGGIGVGAGDQKVALVRVAHFDSLTISDGAMVTTSPWNGLVGGVIAIRAQSAQIDGAISVAGGGYRPGRWSQDDASCTESITTEPGESIAGFVAATTAANFGAPGGLGAASGVSFIGSAPMNAGASHATAGGSGFDNANSGRTVGAAGATYGTADASTLTFGSGASGNLTCSNANTTGPVLLDEGEGPAGGIVLLLTDQLAVGANGTISASAKEASRNVSASGGEVFIKGGTLALGDGRVTALGGTGVGQGVNASATVSSGDGYIVVQAASVTGTTTPAAHQL